MSDNSVKTDQIAEIYAKSLYNSLNEKEKNEAITMLAYFKNELQNNQNLKNFFNSQIIPTSEYLEFISNIEDKFSQSPIFVNFLKVLAEKKRLNYLDQIAVAFSNFDYDEQNVEQVTLSSAKKLDDKTESKIKSLLEKKLNKKIIVSQKVDTNLLGGFQIQIGTNMIDLSISGQINNLNNLIKEA